MKTRAFVVVSILIAIAVTFTARSSAKDNQTAFSLASLKGSYAGLFSGLISTPAGLVAILGTGVFVADGAGKFSGHESYTVDGKACTATVSGTYTVNPDGTGTSQTSFTTSTPGCVSGTYTQSLVIAQKGRLVLLSNSNADRITEEWHLQ